MAASPRSTVSSDLYAPSESAQPTVYTKEESSQLDASPAPFSDKQIEETGSRSSDMMDGLDSPGEDEAGSCSPSSGPLNGYTPEASLKRKREHDLESKPVDEPLKTSGVSPDSSFHIREGDILSHVPSNPSKWQDEDPGIGQVKSKRSKIDSGHSKTNGDVGSFRIVSTLPATLWQHVFCFVPPVFLGRLLRVNRAFNTYLTPGNPVEHPTPLGHGIMQPLAAEAIWVASRRRFAPGLPKPIHDFEELKMWRLLVGQSCQVCGHENGSSSLPISDNPCESGPGGFGVRVIWPFGLRCCGSCLHNVSHKEMDLYLSSDCPSFLLQAIPFAFVSKDCHYIAHHLLRNHTIPPTLQLTKHYHRSAVEDIKKKFIEAKSFGAASTEEWIKGLASQGQKRLDDIIRWEQWEYNGGLKKVNIRHHPKIAHSGSTMLAKKNIAPKDDSRLDSSRLQDFALSTTKDDGNFPPNPVLSTDAVTSVHSADKVPTPKTWNAGPPLVSAHHGRQTPIHQPRPERNIKDINDAKVARRAEIERRCALIDPPLLPNVLNHMESFQAAMQITQPMTDQAWQILKPRLLAQLPYAERKEKERMQQDEILAEQYRQRRQQEAQLKETKENFDREWETFQNPVRNRLGALADEVIHSRWAGGRSITKDISPKFAADVLLHVRQRFYDDIAREDEAAIAAGELVRSDLPNGPPTRKLILENMKWLFDTKVKPLTDHFQRELFLCNGCDGNFKFYGFEGVIQHYAAKHTTTLSMGNIVVHWRAEWPEHPPFNPNPSVAKSTYYKVPTPANNLHTLSARDSQGPSSLDTHLRSEESGAPAIPQGQDGLPRLTNAYPPSYAGYSQEEQFDTTASQANSSISTYDPSYTGRQNGYNSSGAHHNSYAAMQQGLISPAYSSSYTSQQPLPAFVPSQGTTNSQGYYAGPGNNTYGGGQQLTYQPNVPNGSLSTNLTNLPGQVSDLYQRQMDEMARHAKDVFTGLSGVKDLPGSVRIYVVIQLTVYRFKAAFPNEPSLSMFIDGLDHNATMRPVRSVNGLGCKTCMDSGTSAKLYTLPHLVNHFRTVHVESPQMVGYQTLPELDWKQDMIDLPDASIISRLIHTAGMTDIKMGLIASVFPELFPSPLPNPHGRLHTGPLPSIKQDIDTDPRIPPRIPIRIYEPSSHFEDSSNGPCYDQPSNGIRPLSRGPSFEPLEPPRDDEYDPHRPAVLSKTVGFEDGFSQSYKQTRLSGLIGGLQSPSTNSSILRLRGLPHGEDEKRPFTIGNGPVNSTSEEHSGRTYNSGEHARRSPSPVPRSASQNGAQEFMRTVERSVPNRLDTAAKKASPAVNNSTKRYRHSPEVQSKSGNQDVFPRGTRRLSPPEAVDAATQFLSSLASKAGPDHSREFSGMDHEVVPHSRVPWQNEPQAKHRNINLGVEGNYDRYPSDINTPSRRGDRLSADYVHAGSSEVRNGGSAIISQRSGSRAQYHEDFRSSSHGYASLMSVKADGSPNTRFESRPVSVHDRQETNGNNVQRPRSGTHNVHTTRLPQYRLTTGSPLQISADTALYCPRSPVEEDRDDRLPRASPPLSRRHSRPQRLVSYEYPSAPRYEYVDDRGLREAQYQTRVEYVRVPMDYEDSIPRDPPAAHYIMSRPGEQVESEYIRYEPAYVGEPIYQRNGQVYHAPQRTYQEQTGRAPHAYALEYEY